MTTGLKPTLTSSLDEVERIEARYAGRKDDLDRASIVPLHRMLAHQEKERVALRFLRRFTSQQLASLKLIEIGSGFGHNLVQCIRWGFDPKNLIGSELLADRTEIARQWLPPSVRLFTGDSSQLDVPLNSQDIVLISTVFSSILDHEFQQTLARNAWGLLKPGGAVFWYDFVVNNPRNPDVRGVSMSRVRQLFPDARFQFYRVTLAPPIARMTCAFFPAIYPIANMFPFLRTHVMAWLEKPDMVKPT